MHQPSRYQHWRRKSPDRLTGALVEIIRYWLSAASAPPGQDPCAQQTGSEQQERSRFWNGWWRVDQANIGVDRLADVAAGTGTEGGGCGGRATVGDDERALIGTALADRDRAVYL